MSAFLNSVQPTSIPSLLEPLRKEIFLLCDLFINNTHPEITAVLLFGSCARGSATYRSDVDLLVILCGSQLTYSKVQEIRDWCEKNIEAKLTQKPLPLQITVVLECVFRTTEPGMKQALQEALYIYKKDIGE